MQLIPVILCGGSGSRLWPLSRELYPKQLLALTGEHTLLQQTALRLSGIDDIQPPLVICNEEHRFLVAEQLRQIGVEPLGIFLEPVGRNTAPAATLAALHAVNLDQNAKIIVLPADHLIKDTDAFQKSIKTGAKLADTGRLVTFGIIPEGPETGYGYIKKGTSYPVESCDAYTIERFAEKPNAKTAASYLADGGYSWNSGMFIFPAPLFLRELEQHQPDIYRHCLKAQEQSTRDLDFTRPEREAFVSCPSDSIDYAVMEKTDKGVVLPIDVGWNDIGAWSALWDVGEKDDRGNVTYGDVLLHDTTNSFIHSSNRLLTAVGMDDCVIVETSDAVLVSRKDQVQDVKNIVTLLRSQNRQEATLHRQVFRPWGSYEGITMGDRFQVKLITVNPGAILSLQMHHHRAEHWIVVKGTAKITKGEEEFLLGENESTFIPLGVTHRLENSGVIPLELIEVQSGSYLGEDDIVRFEDTYGRVD
jgi:mannose-1-phosphate guanylyltransferase/mannose-6-phosphate isomerase